MFVHRSGTVLCGSHHLALYRRESSTRSDVPVAGRWHKGFYHVSLDEVLEWAGRDGLDAAQARLLNEVQSALAVGDFADQLCDYLDGNAPHPLDEDLSFRNSDFVFINPQANPQFYRAA
jgi:hypothetical protein